MKRSECVVGLKKQIDHLERVIAGSENDKLTLEETLRIIEDCGELVVVDPGFQDEEAEATATSSLRTFLSSYNADWGERRAMVLHAAAVNPKGWIGVNKIEAYISEHCVHTLSSLVKDWERIFASLERLGLVEFDRLSGNIRLTVRGRALMRCQWSKQGSVLLNSIFIHGPSRQVFFEINWVRYVRSEHDFINMPWNEPNGVTIASFNPRKWKEIVEDVGRNSAERSGNNWRQRVNFLYLAAKGINPTPKDLEAISHKEARDYMVDKLSSDYEAQAYVDGFANPFFRYIKWTSEIVLTYLKTQT